MNVDVRAVTPDALWELGLSVKTLVGKVEARLCAVNKASHTHTHTPTPAPFDAPLNSGRRRQLAVGGDARRIMVRRMDASVHRLFSDIETILHNSKDLSVVSRSLSE